MFEHQLLLLFSWEQSYFVRLNQSLHLLSGKKSVYVKRLASLLPAAQQRELPSVPLNIKFNIQDATPVLLRKATSYFHTSADYIIIPHMREPTASARLSLLAMCDSR